MLVQGLKSLLIMSAVGSLLTVVLLCIKPVTRRYFSPVWQYYIWLTVLLVMMLPIHISLPNRVTEVPESVVNQEGLIGTEMQPTQSENQNVITELRQQVTKTSVPTMGLPQNMWYYLATIWLMGAIIFLLMRVIKYHLFLRTIYKNSEFAPVNDVPERLTVRQTGLLDAPLIVGIFKPTLFLPDAVAKEGDWQYILIHELTHYKRRDLWYKWFAMLVQGLHWFNPLVYIVVREIDWECEISCDYAVTKEMSECEKTDYMRMILRMVDQATCGTRPLTTQMAGGKRMLKRRFSMIKGKIKVSKKVKVLSAVLAVFILATAVFASGVWKNTWKNGVDNSIVGLHTDEVTDGNFNLLFVGVDEGNRADTIVLLKIRKDEINGLFIPRNTVFDDKRISDIFAGEDGAQAMVDTIRNHLEVPVHYYAKMDLAATKQIIDKTGGIEFEVPQDMVYDDPYQDLHINLKKGKQVLDGEQVCQLLQFKKGYAEGDLSRIQLQQRFVKEFIKQTRSKGDAAQAMDVLKVILNHLESNYPLSHLKKDFKQFHTLSDDEIVFETMPGSVGVRDNMPVYYESKQLRESEYVIYGENGEITALESHPARNAGATVSNPNGEVVYNSNERKEPQSLIIAFFRAFENGNFALMRNYCTSNCVGTYFNGDNVFGIKKASLVEMRLAPSDDPETSDDIHARVTVKMIPSEKSVFDPKEPSASFYMVLKVQQDGKYLINSFESGINNSYLLQSLAD